MVDANSISKARLDLEAEPSLIDKKNGGLGSVKFSISQSPVSWLQILPDIHRALDPPFLILLIEEHEKSELP